MPVPNRSYHVCDVELPLLEVNFAKTRLGKYRLCHADEAHQGLNRSPWLRDTYLDDVGCAHALGDDHAKGLMPVLESAETFRPYFGCHISL